jgi:hypothetical protein
MDALTQNCGNLIPSGLRPILGGFVSRKYMSGKIPGCVWNHTSLQVLHIMGNGLSGTLEQLSTASLMNVLAIGTNAMSGSLPVNFQTKSYLQFDVSFNKLSGTLNEQLSIASDTAVYNVNGNRLSGEIPEAFYNIENVSLYNYLQGNLFSCEQGGVPRSDVDHSSYECGSDPIEYSFLAWVVGAVGLSLILATTAVLVGYSQFKISHFYWLAHTSHLGFTVIAGLIPLIGFIVFKMPHQWSGLFATYSVQYWWTATLAYMHGWPVVLFVLILLVVAIMFASVLLLMYSQRLLSGPTLVTDISTKTNPDSSRLVSVAKIIAVHCINLVIVLTVNAGYVLEVVNRISGTRLLFVQSGLSLFKIAWSLVVIPWMVGKAVAPTERFSHSVFMSLFLFIGAPFSSTFCESSSCFLGIIETPTSLSSQYSVPSISCNAFCEFYCDSADNCKTSCRDYCSFSSASTVMINIVPPWLYSYQCSSAVVTNYTPVLIISFFISGILLAPMLLLYVSQVDNRHFPTVLKSRYSLFCADSESAVRRFQSGKQFGIGRNLMTRLYINLTMLMTFGIACPLLTFAVVVDGLLTTHVWHVIMERYINLCVRGGVSDTAVRQVLFSGFSIHDGQVVKCLYIMMGFIGVFWGLFIFDMIGDIYGSFIGGLCVIVPLFMPMGRCIIFKRRFRIRSRRLQNQSVGFELERVTNPVIVPQDTVDEFVQTL